MDVNLDAVRLGFVGLPAAVLQCVDAEDQTSAVLLTFASVVVLQDALRDVVDLCADLMDVISEYAV